MPVQSISTGLTGNFFHNKMTDEKKKTTGAGNRRRRKKKFRCHCCRQEKPFCWNCTCGFQICPECFEENKWGMSNGPTWICPDCERIHMME